MQNNREHIDDILRDKMQDLQFEVNESHWADAERRLDEDKEKKRPFWIYFVAIALLVGAGLTALTQYQGNKKTNAADYNIAVSTSIAPISGINMEGTNSSEQSSVTQTMTQSQTTANQTTNQNTTVNNQSINTAANSTPTKTNTAVAPATNTQGFTTKSLSTSNQLFDASKTRKNSSDKLANKPISKPISNKLSVNTQDTQNVVDVISSKKAVTQVVRKNTSATKILIDANKKSINDMLKNATSKPEATNSNSSNIVDIVAVQADELHNQISEKQKTFRVYKSPEEYQKLNPRYVANLANYNFTETVIPLDQTKSDSIRNAVAKQENIEPKPSEKKKKYRDPRIYIQEPSSFYILAGLGVAKGYKGNGIVNPAWGLSPSLGVGYEQSFSDRMSMYLSVYMSYISHLNIRESATSVTYSFDRDSTLLSVTRKNLLQLHLPIQLSFKLMPKMSIAAGVGINLGLNSISIYEDSKQSTQDKQFGYMGGLRFMDVNASLGFDYAVTRRISLGLFYQQGFLDMTKNSYFNNQQNDINARGGILMRYKFIK